MQPWAAKVNVISLFVDDLAAARRFYGSVFGRPEVFSDDESVAFSFDNLLVNLLVAPAAPELIEPAPVGGPDSGRRFQLTVRVDDVDAVCATLAERGVQLLNGPVDRPWGVRTAAFQDPSGHVWEVAADR